jgi:hypothetical protein
LLAVSIVLEESGEEFKFLWEGILVTEGFGSVYQGCEDRLFVGRVVM